MEYMPSCDTLAIPGAHTETGRNILAKNSDRDVTEAQLLRHFPAKDHAPGEKVKCTYIEIDEVPHTYAMIGSQPWWMWGFEMGVNECGVAIGNEAEWSNVPPNDVDALLGMDLLRLGLERGATAREALDVIIVLLEKYGQGGSCKYGVTRDQYCYHNTFILSDPKEIYLLETVNSHWVWRRLTEVQGISNIYTIGENYDAHSKGIEAFAVSQGLHASGQSFDFSKSFMLLNTRSMSGFPRAAWAGKQLAGLRGALNAENTLAILRGHYEGELVENRWSPVSCCQPAVCMHGGEPGRCQTAATMVVDYHDTKDKELLFTYWGSVCPPCCSVAVPFYNTGYVPAVLGVGTNKYSVGSFWWKVQRMATDIESNYERYHGWIADVQSALEPKFRKEAQSIEAKAGELVAQGEKSAAVKCLNDFTDACLAQVEAAVDSLTARIESDMQETPGQIYRKPYLDWYRSEVKL
ncbi:MAG TPA: hypothetical protein VN369_02585 [Terriglobales bacterium]|nr:hypothetical protein [Terriglobales bacterium]